MSKTITKTSPTLTAAGLYLVRPAGSHYIEVWADAGHGNEDYAVDIVTNLYDYAAGKARPLHSNDWREALRTVEQSLNGYVDAADYYRN